MKREDFNIQFVDDNFSLSKTSCCPNCKQYICFLPDIKSYIKKECKQLINLLGQSNIKVKQVDRISVKEWTCHSCETIYINIKDKEIMF